jgi:membrane protease YdiL (CAAX protease family)
MTYVFVAAFVLFTFLNVVTRRFGLLSTILGMIMILSTRGYVLLWDAQNNLLALLLFFPLGIVSFYLSLVLSNLNLSVVRSYFPPKRIFLYYLVTDRFFTLRLLLVSLYEELIWRGILPFVFGNLWLGIVSSAVLFALIHVNKRRVLFLSEMTDIFVFALFQGILMILFCNVYLLVLIHTVRNLLIYYWSLGKSSIYLGNKSLKPVWFRCPLGKASTR